MPEALSLGGVRECQRWGLGRRRTAWYGLERILVYADCDYAAYSHGLI